MVVKYKCKDCPAEIQYTEDFHNDTQQKGWSPPERCDHHQRLNSSWGGLVGMPYYECKPCRPLPPDGPTPGRLGRIFHEPRERVVEATVPTYSVDRFGITTDDIREIHRLLQKHRVLIIVAFTGCGKSTVVPYRLYNPPEGIEHDVLTRYGPIIVTQPRIAAATEIPRFVGNELDGSGVGPGANVGYRYSAENQTGLTNKCIYMTDGVLLNWLKDGRVNDCSVIMIDEAHEMSLNISVILSLLKDHLERYPDLRVVISSATIDAARFVAHFSSTPYDEIRNRQDSGELLEDIADSLGVGYVMFEEATPAWLADADLDALPTDEFGGKLYEVEFDSGPEDAAKMKAACADKAAKCAFRIMKNGLEGKETLGDILMFLPGVNQIKACSARLGNLIESEPELAGMVDVYPLYAELPSEEREAALREKEDPSRTRVVIATNLAETSLTISGITHVVDSGLINQSRYDPNTGVNLVVTVWHSKAGVRQRWGRGGRVGHGKVHCLYSRDHYDDLTEYTVPEIQRAPLEQVLLGLKQAGVDSVEDLDWVYPPSEKAVERAASELVSLGAVRWDEESGILDITDRGLTLGRFMQEPLLATAMLQADIFCCAPEAAVFIAAMSNGGVAKVFQWDHSWSPLNKHKANKAIEGLIGACRDDLELIVKVYYAWMTSTDKEAWSERDSVDQRMMLAIQECAEKLLDPLMGHLKSKDIRLLDFDILEKLRFVLANCLKTRIYRLPGEGPLIGGGGTHYIPLLTSDTDAEDNSAVKEVEIDRTSICASEPLEAFVGLQRRMFRKQLSPMAPPETVISAAGIAALEPQALNVVKMSDAEFTRAVAIQTNDESGDLRPHPYGEALRLDLVLPLESVVTCEIQGLLDGNCLPVRVTGIKELHLQDPVDHNGDVPAKGDAEEIEYHEVDVAGRLVLLDEEDVPMGHCECRVDGYDYSERSKPTVLLRVPRQEDPFEVFTRGHQEGDEISVAVTSVETHLLDMLKNPDNFPSYLVVEHADSGMEFIMCPEDICQSGQGFQVRVFKPGEQITVTVEEIDMDTRTARVTYLKEAERDIEGQLRAIGKAAVDGTIAGIAREAGAIIRVSTEGHRIPFSAFASSSVLPKDPEASRVGTLVRVTLRSNGNGKRGASRQLLEVPVGLRELVDSSEGHITLNESEHGQPVLKASARLTYEDRMQLRQISDDPAFRQAVDFIYHRSFSLTARVQGIGREKELSSASDNLEERFPVGSWNKGKVVSVTDYGAFVELAPGVQGLLHKSEIGYKYVRDAKDMLSVGDQIQVLLKAIECDGDRNKISLSSKDPDADPFHIYTTGDLVLCRVTGIRDRGVVVELEQGGTGWIHISEICHQRINHPGEILAEDEVLETQILSMNREKQQIALSAKAITARPKPEIGQTLECKVTNIKDFGAFVDLPDGMGSGLIHISELADHHVSSVEKVVSLGQNIDARVIGIDDKGRISLSIRKL